MGGGEKQFKNKWTVQFEEGETITLIEVGGEMRMKMAHADAVSMTTCSEVKSRAKIITDEADRLASDG